MTEKMNIQDLAGNLVKNEVYCNVSQLVEYSVNKSFEDNNAPITYDDITAVSPDFDAMDEDELKEWLQDELGTNEDDLEGLDEYDLRDKCQDNYFEPEIYEYWAISNWLGSKLEEQGEIIIDAYPTIWARCTTGQAILLDSCIQRIVKNLHPEIDEWEGE